MDSFALDVAFCFFSEPGASSLFGNLFVSSLLLLALVDDVAVSPSSSELMPLGVTCVWTPRNQVGCLKIWRVETQQEALF